VVQTFCVTGQLILVIKTYNPICFSWCWISFNEHNDFCSVQVQAGHTPTVEVLKLLEAFTNEDNFTVWSAINNCLSKLSSLLSCTDYEDLFKAYGRRLMQGVYSRVGWDPRDNESMWMCPVIKNALMLLMCQGDNMGLKLRFESENKVCCHLDRMVLLCGLVQLSNNFLEGQFHNKNVILMAGVPSRC
jgi:hypothetical protein